MKRGASFEYLERAKAKRRIVVPVTLLIIFLCGSQISGGVPEKDNARNSHAVCPFALVGGVWLMWWSGRFNIASPWRLVHRASRPVAAENRPVVDDLIYSTGR